MLLQRFYSGRHGTHTVQTYVYSNNGAFMNAYNFTYRIYKP